MKPITYLAIDGPCKATRIVDPLPFYVAGIARVLVSGGWIYEVSGQRDDGTIELTYLREMP